MSYLEDVLKENNPDIRHQLDLLFIHIGECKECMQLYQRICSHLEEIRNEKQ